jgi:hypothetical protein
MGRKIFKDHGNNSDQGSHFTFDPPRITAPRMKLNSPINLQNMGCSQRSFPTSKIFLTQFLKRLGVFPQHR